MNNLPSDEAAKLLGISTDELGTLEKQGVVHSTISTTGINLYNEDEIIQIKSRQGLSISQEADLVESEIQKEVVTSSAFAKKTLTLAGATILIYLLLIGTLTVLFSFFPLETTSWLGYIPKAQETISLKGDSSDSRVLAATTSSLSEISPLQTILQPMGKVSLNLVKLVSPNSYSQVASITILDTNDVLIPDKSGAIVPTRPIKFPESSLLEISDSEIIQNLNSQYLQGRIPGSAIGDLAIVGENETLLDLEILDAPIFALSSSSLSLVGNTGTGSVTLGGTLTLTGAGIANITASGTTFTITATEADTLTSVTERGASTSTGLTLNGGITTTTTTALTLDSGTTGGVSIGTGANAKTITIGNVTGATSLNLNSGTGNINFTVDGTASSGKVQIGNSGTATPDLLVLDNGTADPTGVNGGMYYNSSTTKFRCFENSTWTNCIGLSLASDLQHSASYDNNEAVTNIPTGGAQVILGTVSVTPTHTTGDVLVNGWADVYSGSGTDQPLQIVIETTNNCTGSTVGNANVTYTITSGTSAVNDRGSIRISGIALNPGASAQNYSLCAAVTSGAGDSDILNWGIDALVIDTGAN